MDFASAFDCHEWIQSIFDAVFPRNLCSNHLEITTVAVVMCGGRKKIPVHQHNIVISIFSGPFCMLGSTLLF